MTLVQGDITKVAEAMTLSRDTLRIIRQNLFWAFAYNSIAIPVAVLGMFILWFGWMGFNGGSIPLEDPRLPQVLINTLFAACAAGVTAMIPTMVRGTPFRTFCARCSSTRISQWRTRTWAPCTPR